jgi:hypothetical protein
VLFIKNSDMPHFFLKLLYLKKHSARFDIFCKFILFQLSKPFTNFKRSKQKKNFQQKYFKKKITHNFFSINAYDWLGVVNFNVKNYLEIGSFEGLSILFVNEIFKPDVIHAVDTWKGSNEHGPETNFKKVEINFLNNTKNWKNIKRFKMTSDSFFLKKNHKYDLIYIDGLHTRKQVKKDLLNSLKLCHKKSIIICDDFFWKFDKRFTKNIPIEGIIPIIKKNKLKVISVTNNQIFLKLNLS